MDTYLRLSRLIDVSIGEAEIVLDRLEDMPSAVKRRSQWQAAHRKGRAFALELSRLRMEIDEL